MASNYPALETDRRKCQIAYFLVIPALAFYHFCSYGDPPAFKSLLFLPEVTYSTSRFLPPVAFSTPSTALIPRDLPDSPLCPAPCTSPPSRALPGTFAPWPGLIHLATPLRPGELKALFVCTPWEILTPRLHAPTKQRKHLLTAKALTNSVFQMNPAPCGAEGGERPGQKSPKLLLVFADYRKPGGAVLGSRRVDSLYREVPT